jgi:hypothetical protein
VAFSLEKEWRAATNLPDVFTDAFDFARDAERWRQKPAPHHDKNAKKHVINRMSRVNSAQYLLPLVPATLMLYFKPGTPQECMLT